MLPEILTTSYGIIANFVSAFAILLAFLLIKNKAHDYLLWVVAPVIVSFIFLGFSVDHIEYKQITDVEFTPLIDYDKAIASENMTIVPFNIKLTKTTVNSKNPKSYFYNYSSDFYLQQSEMIKIKNGENVFKITTDTNNPDCLSISYGNRYVDVIRPGNKHINCRINYE